MAGEVTGRARGRGVRAEEGPSAQSANEKTEILCRVWGVAPRDGRRLRCGEKEATAATHEL